MENIQENAADRSDWQDNQNLQLEQIPTVDNPEEPIPTDETVAGKPMADIDHTADFSAVLRTMAPDKPQDAVHDAAKMAQGVFTQIVSGGNFDDWGEIVAKGIFFDDAVAKAQEEGRIKGRNEQIEIIESKSTRQLDDFEKIQAVKRGELQLLVNPRKSVWDIDNQ